MCHSQTSAWLLSSALYAISNGIVDALLHIYQSVLEQRRRIALSPHFIIVSATKVHRASDHSQHLIPTFAASLFQSPSDTILKWTLEQRK